MIKLPIVLETEPNWQQCLADAIARRGELQMLAEQERRKGAAYLRPVILIQAEKRRQGVETLDVERVQKELADNHRVPPEEIVIATGEERGLEMIDSDYVHGIADEACPVKFVITQQALAEGWDCPFAYILVSMATLHSATSVEQLLGRVLRQPEARHRDARALNQSYAFVVSRDFGETARSLRDRLVEASGFERREVAEFVVAAKPEQAPLDIEGHTGRIVIHPVVVPLPEKPNLRSMPKDLRDKLAWDDKAQTLTISQPLNARGRGNRQASGEKRARKTGHSAGRRSKPHKSSRVLPDASGTRLALCGAANCIVCSGRACVVRRSRSTGLSLGPLDLQTPRLTRISCRF